MISKYGLVCEVIESGSFSGTAERFGYSQSAVSQAVRGLERELGSAIVERRRGGVLLTEDGKAYYPYLRSIYNAEQALQQKTQEMHGLENSVIRLGTFTTVSRDVLPRLLQAFKRQFPQVRFELRQGEYTTISEWIRDGSLELGFISMDLETGLETMPLYTDEMAAVLPLGHPLENRASVTLQELSAEPFILIDEGEYSTIQAAFSKAGLVPQVEYRVTDDYSILAMIRENLGVSALYRRVLKGYEEGVRIVPIAEPVRRTVGLTCRNWDTLSYAARHFVEHVRKTIGDLA